MYAGTTEQFHENGYFADPQIINELAQYWEDQRNIDSLLGNVQEQHDADDVSVQHYAEGSPAQGGVTGAAQQQPLQNDLVGDQQSLVLPEGPEHIDTDSGSRNQAATDEAKVNPLSNLVNYSSSDEES